MFCGRRAVKGSAGGPTDPFYCMGCDRTPGRCRCAPRPDELPEQTLDHVGALAQALTECAPARPGIWSEAEAVVAELVKLGWKLVRA